MMKILVTAQRYDDEYVYLFATESKSRPRTPNFHHEYVHLLARKNNKPFRKQEPQTFTEENKKTQKTLSKSALLSLQVSN